MIKENENIINNYHQKEVYSSNVLFKRKPKLKNNSDNNFFNNIIPIKKKNYRKFEENKNIKEENVYKEHKEKNQKEENINKKIKIIIPENKKVDQSALMNNLMSQLKERVQGRGAKKN